MSIHSHLKTILLAGATIPLISTAEAQFSVRTVDAPGSTSIVDINQAEALLASQPTVGSGDLGTINFVGGGTDADFPGGVNFPGSLGGTDQFAMEARALLLFHAPGSYVFQVNSDDGFRLWLDVNYFDGSGGSGGTVYSEFITQRGPVDTNGPAFTIPPGVVGFTGLRLTYFESVGGEEIEFSYSLNGGPQQLVGSTSDLSLLSIPEPRSLALLGAGVAGFAARRRRG